MCDISKMYKVKIQVPDNQHLCKFPTSLLLDFFYWFVCVCVYGICVCTWYMHVYVYMVCGCVKVHVEALS